MAARRPRAGPRPQPSRTAYDAYDPKSEWKDEPAANVLNVYLPEFVKNQISVRFDQVNNTLNVSAERPSGNNRIVGVNKEYQIPGNSNLRDMKGKFEDETLTITIAKVIASKVDLKPEADKTTQEPSGTQKPAEEKIPTPPAAPPPPLNEEKSKEKSADIPSQRPAEGKDLPDPSVHKETTKTKFMKDEGEQTPPSRTLMPRDEKVPTSPAAPPPSRMKQKSEEEPAKVPYLFPDPWREMEEGRDFPDPNVLKGKIKAKEDENQSQTPLGISTSLADPKKSTGDRKSAKPDDDNKEIVSKWKESARLKDRIAEERKEPTPDKGFSWKGKKPEETKEYFSEQEMKMSNDIPGSQELGMKGKEESTFLGPRGEETDIYAAARQAMLDLTMRIKEDRQLVINMGVAALVIVALGSYISYTIGLSGEGDKK